MNNSKNLKEFFANTKARFRGKLGTAFLATLISVFPFAVILIGAAWLSAVVHGLFAVVAIVALVIFGNMQVGHIRFMRELSSSDSRPNYGLLFSGFTGKNMLMYLFLGIVLFVIYLFSTILFVVPVFFAIGAFSMVFYFVEHHDYDNFLDALSTSEKRMRRQKGNMFAYKGIFYIVYLLAFVVLAIALVFISRIEATMVMVLLNIITCVLFYVLFSLVTAIYSMCNHNFFAEVLDYAERRAARKAATNIVAPRTDVKPEEEKLEKVQAVEEKKTVRNTTKKDN